MADGYSPPQGVRNNAKRGLELRRKYNRGGTAVGVARARDLSNGTNVSLDTIKRMTSYFARHEVDKKGKGWGVDSAGYIAWLLWGGDLGWSWAKGIVEREKNKDKSFMQGLAHSYAVIEKTNKNDDGTLTVYGKATDDSIDIDMQICDEEWLKRAMPDWMMSGGNVREQHSNIAAGVATDYEAKSDGHYITALVVDPVSVKKVETGVLKGFSIGIRGPRVIRDSKAAGGRIVDGQIVEISLVDRPANPNAKMTIAKASEGGELVAVTQGVPTPKDIFTGKAEKPENPFAEDEEKAPVEEEVADDSAQLPETDAPDKSSKLYDSAVQAITNLIKYETDEIAEGDGSEHYGILCLLEAMSHLQRFAKGEVEEGEMTRAMPEDERMSDDISMAAEPDICPNCEKSMDECKCADKSASFDDAAFAVVIEKAIASAKASVTEELELLKAANKAAEAETVRLTEELNNANKAVAGGGPKRAATGKPETQTNELLAKAAEYRRKADTTLDQVLSKGYRELAIDLEAKASRKDV
jgi:hypothetical protein